MTYGKRRHVVVVGVEEDAVERESLGEDDQPAEELPEHSETGVLLPGQCGPRIGKTLPWVLQQHPLDLQHLATRDGPRTAVEAELHQKLAAVGVAEDPDRLAQRGGGL